MSNWKKKAGFAEPKAIEQEFGGATVKFWPVSVGKAIEARSLLAPLLEAFSVILGGMAENTSTTTTKTHKNGTVEVTKEASSPEILAQRSKDRSQAVSKAVHSLASPESLALVGGLLKDSLRDVFDDPKDKTTGKEIGEDLTPVELREALTGLARANAEVLGPLAGAVGAVIKQIMAALANGLNSQEVMEALGTLPQIPGVS